MTETDVQREILEAVQAAGVFAWRNNTGRRGGVSYGLKGSADIIGVLPDGRFLAIEVKGPKTPVRQEQWDFLDKVADNGGLAMVARSVDDVVETLLSGGAHYGRRSSGSIPGRSNPRRAGSS